MRDFRDVLFPRWEEGKFVCVGLDSTNALLPRDPISGLQVPQTRFNLDIVEATKDIACAYKPNLAFYPGDEGKKRLRHTIRQGKNLAPDALWVLDAKELDIGNTNEGYVEEAFDYFRVDAITIHNYLGHEAAMPFLKRKDRLIFVLCRTSNPGAGEFQDLNVTITEEMYVELSMGFLIDQRYPAISQQTPLYEWVAWRVSNGRLWNQNGNCGLVVGATVPEELQRVREIAPEIPLLIPGIGAQGGDLDKTVKAAGNRFLINSSRGIIFASKGMDYADAARRETMKLHTAIRALL